MRLKKKKQSEYNNLAIHYNLRTVYFLNLNQLEFLIIWIGEAISQIFIEIIENFDSD